MILFVLLVYFGVSILGRCFVGPIDVAANIADVEQNQADLLQDETPRRGSQNMKRGKDSSRRICLWGFSQFSQRYLGCCRVLPCLPYMFNRCFYQFALVIQRLTRWFLFIERSMVCSVMLLFFQNKGLWECSLSACDLLAWGGLRKVPSDGVHT